jgi:hypothetical protein
VTQPTTFCLQRYAAIIDAVQQDPTVFFDVASYTERILAYLALCAPASRCSASIQHAAHIPYRSTGKFLTDLCRKGAVERVRHGWYRLATPPDAAITQEESPHASP